MLFLLNNIILTFHDLFTFTESIDNNQQPLFNLSKIIIICGGGEVERGIL